MKTFFAFNVVLTFAVTLGLGEALATDSSSTKHVTGAHMTVVGDIPTRHLRRGSSIGFGDEKTDPLPPVAGQRQKKNKKSKKYTRPDVCTSNKDCDATSYCAAGKCLSMGSCESKMDCYNPSNQYPVIECTGHLLCSEDKQCSRVCGPECEDGISFPTNEQCDVVPCDIAGAICTSTGVIASCQNDYCGGCNALVFDKAGDHELCVGPVVQDETGASCESSEDCADDGSEYCSNGTCVPDGQCQSTEDCSDPDNIFATIDCVGPLTCNDDGYCGRTCSDAGVACESTKDCAADGSEFCSQGTCVPDGQCQSTEDCSDPDNIFATVACVGPLTCNDDGYCGRTCSDAGVACKSTKDCADDGSEYCSQGTCVPDGQCQSTEDCSDPDNIFATIACVGPLTCNDEGFCGRTCSDATTLGDPCKSSDDCSDLQYCQRGVCADMGHCLSDVDCFNRDNQYPVVLCVGPLTCSSDNQCGVTCADSSCPAEQPPVKCLVSPCSVLESSCSQKVASCVDQYCGSCTALAFDKAGNQVCQTGQ